VLMSGTHCLHNHWTKLSDHSLIDCRQHGLAHYKHEQGADSHNHINERYRIASRKVKLSPMGCGMVVVRLLPSGEYTKGCHLAVVPLAVVSRCYGSTTCNMV
jgi:hypothetical protein